jgi:hypothetical protein
MLLAPLAVSPPVYSVQAVGHAALQGARGSATVKVAEPQSMTVVLTFRPNACLKGTHCLPLSGTVRATVRLAPAVPDVGQAFVVTGTGRLGGLGRVRVTGRLVGVGFIARGRCTMSLTLAGARARVSVTGTSGLVKGFTSPL